MKPKSAMVSFSVFLAKIIGDRKAVLLKEIAYWVKENEKNHRNIRLGLPWTYMSAEGYADKFSCYTAKSIGRWLREMEEGGLIVSGSFNRMKADRTKWYTTNPELVGAISKGDTSAFKALREWCRKYKEHVQRSLSSAIGHYPNQDGHNLIFDPALLTISRPLLKMGRAIPPRTAPWNTARNSSFTLSKKNQSQNFEMPDTEQGTPPQKVPAKSSPNLKDWMQVADEMADYFKGEGWQEWKRLCAAGEVPSGSVSIDAICSQWAAKHQNAPELLSWKTNTGALIGWIRTAAKIKKPKNRKRHKIDEQKYEKYRNQL